MLKHFSKAAFLVCLLGLALSLPGCDSGGGSTAASNRSFVGYSAEEREGLAYGDVLNVDSCDSAGTCQGVAGQRHFIIPRTALSIVQPPPRTQYAWGAVRTYVTSKTAQEAKKKLSAGEKVTLQAFDEATGRVRIDNTRWVNVRDLHDHRETAAERSAKIVAERSAREGARTARKAYAEKLREHYLDDSLDIKVSVSGPELERITLKFALFNDVWAHKLAKGDLMDEIRGMGFKRLDMTDGFEYHVYWNL